MAYHSAGVALTGRNSSMQSKASEKHKCPDRRHEPPTAHSDPADRPGMVAGSCFREGSWSRRSTTFDKLAALTEYCCYRQRSDARCCLLLRMRSLGEEETC